MRYKIVAAQYDFVSVQGNVLAHAFLKPDGTWLFRDLKDNWVEDSGRPLRKDQLLRTYKEIKKRKNIERRLSK